MTSYWLTSAPALPPRGSRAGWLMTIGTFTEFSYMFSGKVPLPLPQKPWWPQENPLSLVKTINVSSRRPRASRRSRILPTFRSMAVTAAK